MSDPQDDDQKVGGTSSADQADADRAAADLPPGSGDSKARQDQRLEEGLEETFPASDPVSAKHIT